MSYRILVMENGGFRVELEWYDDNGWDFSHYGSFCELERNRYGEGPAKPNNDPKGGDFYIRNPQAWTKAAVGNGTDSWVRADRRSYGWFKLTEHPRHEVEYLMKEKGLSEREAWAHVLDRLDTLVENLAANTYALVINVEVFWGDELVGDATCGGIEVDGYAGDEEVIALAHDHDLISEALGYGQQKVNKMCAEAMKAHALDVAHGAPKDAA